MKYTCPDCGKVIEDTSFYMQRDVIIKHERSHKNG